MAVRQPPAHVSLPGEGLPGQNSLIRFLSESAFLSTQPGFTFEKGNEKVLPQIGSTGENIIRTFSLIKNIHSHDIHRVQRST